MGPGMPGAGPGFAPMGFAGRRLLLFHVNIAFSTSGNQGRGEKGIKENHGA